MSPSLESFRVPLVLRRADVLFRVGTRQVFRTELRVSPGWVDGVFVPLRDLGVPWSRVLEVFPVWVHWELGHEFRSVRMV